MSDDRAKKPANLADEELDGVVGGVNLGQTVGGPLEAKIAKFSYDEDGNLAAKTLIATASGSGNVAGQNGPTGGIYKFDEVIDGEFVPVTYKLD